MGSNKPNNHLSDNVLEMRNKADFAVIGQMLGFLGFLIPQSLAARTACC